MYGFLKAYLSYHMPLTQVRQSIGPLRAQLVGLAVRTHQSQSIFIDFEPACPRWDARIGRSASLAGSKWDARSRSASLGLSKSSDRTQLGFAGARELAARQNQLGFRWGARIYPIEPARPRWAASPELTAGARSALLGRSTGQSRSKTKQSRQVKLTRRRFAEQDHACLLRSTQRQTDSVTYIT